MLLGATSLVPSFVRNLLMDTVYNYFSGHHPAQPTFCESDIWMLGKCYHRDSSPSSESSNPTTSSPAFPEFIEDFREKLWFSYRRDFPPISPTTYDSDVGWGCTLRSGQMLLAQALVTQYLGRDWKQDPSQPPPSVLYQIVKWFGDQPSRDFPYSIHNIAKAGQRLGKNIGEWFGPSTIAHALGELVISHSPDRMTVYVSEDSSIYLDQIHHLCTATSHVSKAPASSSSSPSPVYDLWRPLLILIPLRLGLENINEVYIPSLLATFQFPQSLGIVGGRPRSSLYFVACQDSGLFYLDPHFPQPTTHHSPDALSFDLSSYHHQSPRKIPATDIDPSLALAFYCRDRAELDDFVTRATKLTHDNETPLFTIASKVPDYLKEVGEGKGVGGDEFSLDEEENEIPMDDLIVL